MILDSFMNKELLLKEAVEAEQRIHPSKIGFMAWKFHPFLRPDENRELQRINFVNLHQAILDNISSTESGLVVRNTLSNLDYDEQYRINRDVDNDRKTHIIYGFGCLDGKVPKSVEAIRGNGAKYQEYSISNPSYFNWFDPLIVLRRRDDFRFKFDVDAKYKIYGMTCEALGAHVCG